MGFFHFVLMVLPEEPEEPIPHLVYLVSLGLTKRTLPSQTCGFDLADTKVHNQDVRRKKNSMSPWAALFEVIALMQPVQNH